MTMMLVLRMMLYVVEEGVMSKKGAVVVLNSGGAPLTVLSDNYNKDGDYLLGCVSVGGMAQTVIAPSAAFKLYYGPTTPSFRKQ